jgi:hypothetical protein
MLRLADRQLAQWVVDGRLQAAQVSEQEAQQEVELGDWQATISFGAGRRFGPPPATQPEEEAGTGPGRRFGAPPKPSGRAVIAQLGENEFVVMATECRVAFTTS